MNLRNYAGVFLILLGVTLSASSRVSGVFANAQEAVVKASIAITVVPHAGAGGPEGTEIISGKVAGESSNHVRVVVYAFAGGNWWVQPTTAEPLTDVNEAGEWTTETHLGTSYAALLVKPSYRPENVIVRLPSVDGDVIAIDRKAGR